MVEMTDAAAKRRRRQQRPTEEEEGSSVGGTGMSKPPPTTTTTGVDIVPNGIAFNVAKRWLKVDAKSNSSSSSHPSNVISLEAFLNDSKREEREEKPRSQRLGLGAKYLSHSKASRTMRTISEKKIIDRMERERKREEERKLDLKRAMESSSESDDDDDEDVRGLSKSKKKNRVENFDASKYRKK